jgi:hypothetical protein
VNRQRSSLLVIGGAVLAVMFLGGGGLGLDETGALAGLGGLELGVGAVFAAGLVLTWWTTRWRGFTIAVGVVSAGLLALGGVAVWEGSDAGLIIVPAVLGLLVPWLAALVGALFMPKRSS